jgi:redox-sensitive bicupin YhaK (pirin superfamily)
MFLIRRSEARGAAEFSWLQTRYTFSFAGYYDPHHMGLRSLRVINEDIVAPGKGFPMHAHSDMEILTIVLSGQIEHRDSLGHTRRITAGQVQCMTAGTGVQHSEHNPSLTDPLHLLQIWIEPAELGLPPSYQEAEVDLASNRLLLIAAPLGEKAPLQINQEAWVWQGLLDAGSQLPLDRLQAEHQWLQIISGEVSVGPHVLKAGDGVAISREPQLVLKSEKGARILLFDLK